jgi:hypothetical protein
MNEEDKKRFARYRKGYIPTLEDENELNGSSNNNNNKTTKIGFIENINVNVNVLVNDIIINNTTKTHNK